MIFAGIRKFFEFHKAFAEGKRQEILGDYHLASRAFLYAVAINSDNKAVNDAIIRNTAKNGKYEEALDFALNAIRKFPEAAKFYAYKGEILTALKRYEEAAEAYCAAAEKDSKNYDYSLKRAYLRFFSDDIQGAINDCNAALSKRNNIADIYAFRGFLKFEKRFYISAAEDYSSAITLNPAKGHYYFMRALCRKENDDISGFDADIKTAQSAGIKI